jgi:hypothetical protein
MVGVALPAAAQDVPKMDVGIAYAGMHSDFPMLDEHEAVTDGGLYKYGFNFDTSYTLNETWSIVAELGWVRHSVKEAVAASHANYNQASYGGGLRWNRRGEGMSTFAQLVVGVAHDTFDTGTGPALGRFVNKQFVTDSLMVQPGAGVVIPMTDAIGFVAQADFRRIFSDPGANGIRFAFGVRVHGR